MIANSNVWHSKVAHPSSVDRFSEKEKQSWSSVGGFGMETSNFALNGCLRVSTVRFFDARSNGRLRMSHRAL